MDMFDCLRKKYGCLSGCIAASHNGHLFVPAQLRFKECGSVIHAVPFEMGKIFEWQLAVFSSGGDDHHPGRHICSAINFDKIRSAPTLKAHCAASNHHLCAELLRLCVPPPR